MNIKDYSYVKVPKITGNIKYDVRNLLVINNKEDTFHHVKAVANTNIDIAKQFGLDEYLCEMSGYLHDISVVINPNDMLAYMVNNNLFIDEAEKKYPFILHQRISKLLSQSLFNITDKTILSAVECHTTLKSQPSKYDIALFIADKLSWDQEGKPPFYDVVKNALSISLEKACLEYINYIIDNNIILYPHSWLLDGKRYLEKVSNIR